MPGELNSGPAPQVLILNTAHGTYRDLDFAGLSGRGLKVVVDGRNFFDRQEVEQAGVVYFGIGRGRKVPAGDCVKAEREQTDDISRASDLVST